MTLKSRILGRGEQVAEKAAVGSQRLKARLMMGYLRYA